MKKYPIFLFATALLGAVCVLTTCSKSGEQIKLVAVTGVTLNKSSLSLVEGASETLTATVSPDDATLKTVSWSSSDAAVATVSNGTVTAVKAGSAVIVATTTEGGKTAMCNVTVTAAAPAFVAVANITGVPTSAVAGVSLTLTATVTPAGATNQTITWSVASAGTTGANISGNTLTATAAGTVAVRATVVNGLTATTNYTQEFSITVSEPIVPMLSVSTAALDFSSAAGSQTFNVTSNVTGWTVASNQTWATVAPATGNNNGTVTVTVTANTGAASRTATITVSGPGVTARTVTITQAGTAPASTLSVSTSALDFSSAAGSQSFNVTSNVTGWTVASNQTWATVAPATGNNNATVTVTVTANTGATSRTATITVSGPGVTSRTVTITQEGATPASTLSVSTSTLDFSSAAGSQTFNVTSNVTGWTVASNQTWATVAPATGNNNGTVTVTVTANTGSTSRTATITVSGPGVTARTVTITQAGTTPAATLSVSTSALDFSSAAGSQTFNVTSNVTGWTVASNQTWATVAPATGNNNGTVTVTVTANTATTSRTATITVSGSGVTSRTVTITQAGASVTGTAPTIALHPSDRTVISGGTTTFTCHAIATPDVTSMVWQSYAPGGFGWAPVPVSPGLIHSVNTTTGHLATSTLTLTDAPNGLNGQRYRCVVTNDVGSTTSFEVKLTVTAQPFLSGDGTSSSPYLINNAADLAKMSELINNGIVPYANEGKYYRLNADINLSGYSSGTGWTPIGTKAKPFKGNFDGNKKTISNLTINSTERYRGLFGGVEEATIQNLGLVNVNIKGGNSTGGVAGEYYSGSITGCYVTGSVNGVQYIGGIAGKTIETNISNCYTTCSVSGSEGEVGGIVGYASNSTVSKCYATGAITGIYYVGGIVGYNISTTSYCFALNVSVNRTSGTYTSFGRVVGGNASTGTLSYNYGFADMTTNSGVTFVIGHTGKDGGGISKDAVFTQNSYENTARANWGFGTTDASPWKMGVGAYKLPVFYWQTTAPGATPAHLN